MPKLSKLRELFHELPNCINGIYIIAYTLADHLEHIDYYKTKRETIKVECVNKVSEIDKYRSRTIETMNNICSITGKLNLPKDCLDIWKDIDNKYSAVCRVMTDAKIIAYDGLQLTGFKEDALELAKVLRKFEPECYTLGKIVQKFKTRLIELDKYYTVTDEA